MTMYEAGPEKAIITRSSQSISIDFNPETMDDEIIYQILEKVESHLRSVWPTDVRITYQSGSPAV